MADRVTALFVVGRLQSRLDRVLDEVAESLAGGMEVPEWQPLIDVVESAESVVLIAEVPGMTAEEITVEVSGNLVVVRGEKAADGAYPGGRFLCVETGRGRFRREVQLLHPVNSHRGRARLENGVLEVAFPRIQDLRRQPHTVSIETTSDKSGDQARRLAERSDE